MIANFNSSGSFYTAANYNEQKVKAGQAEVLDSQHLRKTNPVELQKYFDRFQYSRVSKPALHISLSFAQADKPKLSNEKMVELSKEYLQKMGYAKQPYVLYRHHDTPHPHVHILTSRIDIHTRKKLPHAFEQRKSKEITDKMEVKHGLTISDNRLQLKRELVGDIQKAIKNGQPDNLKSLNRELEKIGSAARVKSTGRGLVYYKVEEGGNRKGKSAKSSLFKDVGLDKKSLEKTFAFNQQKREYVKGNIEKVLAKSPQVNATTFARALREKGIDTEFKIDNNQVNDIKYSYQNHSYGGADLDTNLSFEHTKKQLNFPDANHLQLRQNLLNNLQSRKPIELTYRNHQTHFLSTNPALNEQLKALPRREAIQLSRQFNDYQTQYQKADFSGQKLIKGFAEDKLDEYLQKQYQQRQLQNERRIND